MLPNKPCPYVPDYSFDIDDCYVKKLAAQVSWNQRRELCQDEPSLHHNDSISMITNLKIQPEPNAKFEFAVPATPAKKTDVVNADKTKVMIPGRNLYDEPIFVNPKQAKRMLIMREKKTKKFLKAHTAVMDAQKLKKVADQVSP